MPSACDPDQPPGGQWGIIYRAYHEVADDDVTVEYGLQLLREFRLERGFYAPARRLLTAADAGIVVNAIPIYESLHGYYEKVEATGEDAFRDLAMPEGGFETVEIFTTGIEWLDTSFNGGQAAPELCGINGATGSGKSTMVMQLAMGTSEHFRTVHRVAGVPLKHAVVVSYEDDGQRLLARALSCAARIHKDELLTMDRYGKSLSRRGHLKDYELKLFGTKPGFDPATFPGEYQRMKTAQAEYYLNFHTIYMGGDGRGDGFVEEIVAQLGRAQDRHGWEYGAIYIDSLDWLVGNYMAAQGMNSRDHKRGVILDALPRIRRKIGERFGAVVWVTNQLAGANLLRPSTTKFDHSQAGDSKDWGRPLDWAWNLGNLDPDSNTVLHCSKARRAGKCGVSHIVGLRGEFGRFVSLDSTHTMSHSRFVARDFGDTFVPPVPECQERRTVDAYPGDGIDILGGG
jgi:hypothetical protein